MYKNAVANNDMFHLGHDFYNITFKTKHKLHIDSTSAPHPTGKILGVHPSSLEIR
jgi:hypothetical protein